MNLSGRVRRLEQKGLLKSNGLKVIIVGPKTTKGEYDRMVKEAEKEGARMILTLPQERSEGDEEEGPDYRQIFKW